MSKILEEIVSLAVEVLDSQSSAMDQSRDQIKSSGGRYDRRTWALDVLKLLPDDRLDAQEIVRAHCPGQTSNDDPKRINKLIRNYYKTLESNPSLTIAGCRFLHQLR